MNKFLKIVVLISISILISNCNKKQTNLEFEKEVMYQVFSEVLDSVYRDANLIIPPPPIKYKEQLRKYNEELSNYKNDTSKKVVIIEDNVRGFFMDNELRNTLKDFKISDDSLSFSKSYKFDISNVDSKKYEFKYRSVFPENDNLLWEGKKHNDKLSGEIVVSRIIFDIFKEKGFFYCSYKCGMKVGMGHNVFIKKIKRNWVIDKIENTWIS